jgi:hypothetical protein
MSPLAEAIYQVLIQRVGLGKPLISYKQLVKSLPMLGSPYEDLTQNDDRLFRALGEVGRACREEGLPTLTALVIRSMQKSPGSGYFQMFHPETGDDEGKQIVAWEGELARLKSTKYPRDLSHGSTESADTHLDERQRSSSLGELRVAENSLRGNIVFTGQIRCPSCSSNINVQVERNAKALTPKQPAFVVVQTAEGKPVGHLFIGTILTSPVLYYGSLSHCGGEQRVAVFYNRGLRDRTDHHLIVMPSTSAQQIAANIEADEFKLS